MMAIEKVVTGKSERELMFHSPVCQALMRLENRIRAEAAAWVRKYFVAASMARGWGVFVIKGIIARVLISRPTQASIQWKLERVIVVPIARLNRKIVKARGFISKGRILTDIVGVWAQKLV